MAAPRCQNTGNFDRWLADFKKDALAQGISPKILAEAAPDLTFDPAIIKRDQGQAVFNLTFLQFSDRLISKDRMVNGEAGCCALEGERATPAAARMCSSSPVPMTASTSGMFFWISLR